MLYSSRGEPTSRRPASARSIIPISRSRTFAPQLEALNLAGRGFWQLVAELDPARILEGRELELDMLLQRAGQGVARVLRRLEHHERLRLDQAVAVEPGHHR